MIRTVNVAWLPGGRLTLIGKTYSELAIVKQFPDGSWQALNLKGGDGALHRFDTERKARMWTMRQLGIQRVKGKKREVTNERPRALELSLLWA